MFTAKFPYRQKRISLGAVVDPLIQIHIKASYGWQPIWILVDSGADTTTLTVGLAQRLGIEFRRNDREKLYGIGDKAVYGYPGVVKFKLDGLTFKARAHFLEAKNNILLLGRMDLFDKFTIIFDNSQKKQIIFRAI